MVNQKIKGQQMKRFLESQKSDPVIDVEARTVEVAFSSEQPCRQWFGTEVLLHGKENIQLGRLNNKGAVLVDHDPRDHVGVIERVDLGEDRVARATLRFSNSQRGAEVFQDIVDGIRSKVSVGYQINSYKEEGEGENRTILVDSWEPFEISFVSIPADDVQSGVGRSLTDEVKQMVDEAKELTAAQEPRVEYVVDEAEVEKRAAQMAEKRMALNESFRSQAKTFGQTDLAETAIRDKWDEDKFKTELLRQLETNHGSVEKPAVSMPEVGLTQKESRQFSFVKLIRAMSNPNSLKAQEEAAFELEACDAASRTYGKEAQGAIVPFEVITGGQRDVLVDKGGAADAGSNLVATNLLASSFIDLLYSKMPLVASGNVKVMSGLVGEVAIPKFVSGSSTYWVGENEDVTESGATFGQVPMTPHTIGAMVDLSRRLMIQTTPDAERIIRDNMAREMALGIHNALLNGTGASNQPTGLLNTSGLGVHAMGTNGGAITRDALIELETLINVADAEDGSMMYLTNPKVRGALKKIKVDDGAGMFLYNHLDYPLAVTNQMPSNLDKGTSTGVCSALVLGAFKENLMLGLWSGLDLIVDKNTHSAKGATRIVMHQDVDVAVRDIRHFQAILDITTA